MDLLEVIEIDRIVKLDELILSWFWSQNVQTCNVINMVVNHFPVVIGEEIFIKLSLIGYNNLIGCLNQKFVTACVEVGCKTQMDHFNGLWDMLAFLTAIPIQMHVNPASKWSEFRLVLLNSKHLFMGSGPQSSLEGCIPAIHTVVDC